MCLVSNAHTVSSEELKDKLLCVEKVLILSMEDNHKLETLHLVFFSSAFLESSSAVKSETRTSLEAAV